MEDDRPIHPMKEIDQNIDYISFDKLQILNESQLTPENISLNIGKLSDKQNWQLSFNSMLFFRSLNKQNNIIIHQIIPKIINDLLKLSNSIRSGVSKEAIILTGEIVQNLVYEKKNEDFDIIKKLFNILFQSTSSNKNFIKDTANEYIQLSIIQNKNFFNLDIINIIIDLMKDKKNLVSEICFNTYEKMIKTINLQNPDITDNTWNNFFGKINELYMAKKEIYTKKCFKIIEFFQNNLTKNIFDQILTKLNRNEDINKYDQWILLGSKKTLTQMSFKDFIKSKKGSNIENK
jgi:hypothetical protein